MPAPPKSARVLFDESHSEAWTIRPEVAARDPARRTPPTPRSPAPPPRSPRASSRSPRTPTARSTADVARRRPPCSSSPTPPTRSGRRPSTAARRCSTDAELDAIEAFVARRRRPDRARRDRAGEVRQQPQRAARPLRDRDRERHRPGLRAPPRRRALLGPRRARRPLAATAAPAGADLLAGVARRLLLPRRHPARPTTAPA